MHKKLQSHMKNNCFFLHVWAHDNHHIWCFWEKDVVGLQYKKCSVQLLMH